MKTMQRSRSLRETFGRIVIPVGLAIMTSALVYMFGAVPRVFAQDAVGTVGNVTDNNVDSLSTASSNVSNGAESQSGGNVFDFSSQGNKNTFAPGLTSFGAAPCTGAGLAGSAGVPGLSVGVGYSSQDEGCTRRAWVQAILGASQHMPEMKDRLHRLAFEIMLGDPIVSAAAWRLFEKQQQAAGSGDASGGAMAEAGLPDTGGSASVRRAGVDGAPASAGYGRENQGMRPVVVGQGRTSRGCVIVLARSAPVAADRVLESRGCSAERL